MKKIITLIMMVLVLFTFTACTNDSKDESTTQESTADTYPLTINTYDGTTPITQTFTKKPSRVITNNLSVTEIMIELGLGEYIVGMVSPDNEVTSKYKAEIAKITKIGDKKTISKEIVLSYEPDLVVGRTMLFTSKFMGSVEELNALDINIYAQKASANFEQSFDNIKEDILNLGKIFDVNEKAAQYVQSIDAKLDSLKDNNVSNLDSALVMCAFNGKTFGTYKSQLQEVALNLIGYTNKTTGTSGLTLENLVSINPSIIIYVTSDRNQVNDATAVENLLTNEIISEVPAILNKKIIAVTYDEFMDYGPALIDSIVKISEQANA